MGLELATTTPPASDAPAPDAELTPPASADARAKSAERARKHRALKKLKGAKSEKQLKELAAEVAAPDEPQAPSWPTKPEIMAAAAELAPAIGQAAALLEKTPWELSEKKLQILVLCLSPAAAQAAKSPGDSPLSKFVPPWLLAAVGLVGVFGPPTFYAVRELIEGTPSPAPKVPSAP